MNRVPKEMQEQYEKDQEAEAAASIWTYNPIKKENVISKEGAAKWLLEKYYFITIGDKVFSTLYYKNGFYQPGGEKIIMETLQQATKGKQLNLNTIREILGHIQRETFTSIETINITPKELICLENGILNINTGELKPHEAKIIFTQQIPISYNAQAACPNFLEFLKQTLPAEDIPTFQEFIGYLLLREYSYKKASIFVGEPDTGKTTLINIIVAFIGEKNKCGESIHALSKDKFSRLNLKNKLINIYDDLGSADIEDTGTFKMLTGNSWMSGEHKFGDREMFQNYAKLLFACNKIFGLKDKDVDDDAYYGRWIIFFFNNIIPKEQQDKTLSDRLSSKDEMSGILNWALEGLARLKKQNDFSYSKSPDEIKTLMQRGSNRTAAFVQDCLIESVNGWISKDDMYNIYCVYVEKEGGSRVTKAKFGRELPIFAKYIYDGKKNNLTGWYNVQLNHSNHTFLENISIILPLPRVSKEKSMISLFPQEIDTVDEVTKKLSRLSDAILMPCSRCGTTEIPCKWQGEQGELYCDVCAEILRDGEGSGNGEVNVEVRDLEDLH